MDFYESPMKKKPWTDFEVADSAMLGPPGSFAVPETFQIFLPLGIGVPEKDRNNPTQISHNLS